MKKSLTVLSSNGNLYKSSKIKRLNRRKKTFKKTLKKLLTKVFELDIVYKVVAIKRRMNFEK
ncbi:MAG: hypothetical protein Q4P31_05440 [Andreesenia angusta]|nr:hypothetical protein [Andreesenia angusta]